MLGKLIHYDGKIQLKFLSGVCVVVALISLFSGIMSEVSDAFPKVIMLKMLRYLVFGCSVLAVAALVIGMVIYVVAYFRRNLFRDEGYLMHTLPVTGTQLFFSKLITGSICIYLSILAAIVCMCIATFRWDYISMFIDILKQSGIQDVWTVVMTLLTLLLTIPFSLCQFYVSLVIGYTWKMNSAAPMNRDLLSVAVYNVLYLIQQVMGMISIAVFLVISYGNPFTSQFLQRMETMGSEISTYLHGVLGMSMGLSLTLGVVLAVVSVWRMNHHLNLE